MYTRETKEREKKKYNSGFYLLPGCKPTPLVETKRFDKYC